MVLRHGKKNAAGTKRTSEKWTPNLRDENHICCANIPN